MGLFTTRALRFNEELQNSICYCEKHIKPSTKYLILQQQNISVNDETSASTSTDMN